MIWTNLGLAYFQTLLRHFVEYNKQTSYDKPVPSQNLSTDASQTRVSWAIERAMILQSYCDDAK